MGRPPPETREDRITQFVEQVARRVWGDWPFDEEAVRESVEQSYERAYRPQAVVRHAAAGQRTPSRVEELQRLNVPTLVVHGASDPLIPPDRGLATARLY